MKQMKNTNHKGFSAIFILLGVVAIVAIAGGAYYLGINKGQQSSKQANNSTNTSENHTPLPTTNSQDPKVNSTTGLKAYEDGKIKFSYPSGWEVLKEVPEEYRIINYDINQEGWDKLHLRSKMFAPTCRGPILRNTEVKSTIIAFEVIELSSDGGFCWSNGDFTNSYPRTIKTLTPSQEVTVSKWRANDYIYPVTRDNSGKKYSPPWEGILFQQASVDGENKKHAAVVVVVYKDGTDNNAESVYDQILSTIQVLE